MKSDVYSLELFISKFLRYGVLLAGALMLAGWMSQISFTRDVFLEFQTYHDARLFQVLTDALQDQRWGILITYAGMMILISLPLLRVLMTFAVFLKTRDYKMAGLSALVLLGLAASLLLGFEL